MKFANAEFSNSLSMFLRSVAFMSRKIIMGVFLMPLHHHPVSSDFGDNGGSGNGGAELIPFPDGFLWKRNLEHLVPVDENKIGGNRKVLNGQGHCL